MKKKCILFYIFLTLSVALNIFIIVQSSLEGAESTNQSSWVVALFKNVINTFFPNLINDSNIESFTIIIRKLVGQFGLFFVDGIFTFLALYFSPIKIQKIILLYVISLIFGLLIASLTEIIQSFKDGRSGQVSDVLIDFAGYLIGSFILFFIFFLINHKETKIDKEHQIDNTNV